MSVRAPCEISHLLSVMSLYQVPIDGFLPDTVQTRNEIFEKKARRFRRAFTFLYPVEQILRLR